MKTTGTPACLLERRREGRPSGRTPNLPTNIIPTKVARLKISGKSPMDMMIPPPGIKILLESNPLKSVMLVGRLAVDPRVCACGGRPRRGILLFGARYDIT